MLSNWFSFLDFTRFSFSFPLIDETHSTSFVNQTVWKSESGCNAITDFGYLSIKIPAITDKHTIRNFMRWLFKTNPIYETTGLKIPNNKADVWIKNVRAKIITWLQKEHFIPQS
jgi:hypothetical protein